MKNINVVVFAEDFEIMETFKKVFEKKLDSLRSEVESHEYYKFRWKLGEVFTILAKGGDRLLQLLNDYYENGCLNNLIVKPLKNGMADVVFVIILHDKDKESKIGKAVEDVFERFLKSLDKKIRSKIRIRKRALGGPLPIKSFNISKEFETYFLINEIKKNKLSKNELARYCELIENNQKVKACLLFYLKQILKYKDKPSIRIYLEKHLHKENELCEKLANEFYINEIVCEITQKSLMIL